MNGPSLVAAALVTSTLLGFIPTPVTADSHAPSAYARDLAARINQYRASSKLPPLAIDKELTTLAQEHSAAMAKDRRMSHDGMPSRVRRSGWGMCVENVGWNYPSAKDQFDGWRSSPGHNQNLLDRRVERMGIGIVDGYVTQIACGK